MASRGSPSNKKNKRGVAGPASEAPFERVASYAVRARGKAFPSYELPAVCVYLIVYVNG